MKGFNLGETYAYCTSVWSEAKPVANFEIKKEQLNDVITIISSYELKFKTSPSKWKEDRVEVWIYKYYHLGLIIDEILKFGSELSTYHHWVLGKLFGYSEKAIEEFLERINEEE